MVKNTWTSARPPANRSGTTMSKASVSRPHQLCLSLLAAATLFIVGTDADAQSYTFTALGTLGKTNSGVNAINSKGQAVGVIYEEGGVFARAALWDTGSTIDLGTLGGRSSTAIGINDTGQVVGQSRNESQVSRATLWNLGGQTDVGTLGGSFGAATGINTAGLIVGVSNPADNSTNYATLWSGSGPSQLASLGGSLTLSLEPVPHSRVTN